MHRLSLPVRTLLASGLIVVLAISLSQNYRESKWSRQHEKRIAGLVREQRLALESVGDRSRQTWIGLQAQKGWSDDCLLLETYLISRSVGSSDLKSLISDLRLITKNHSVSARLQVSMDRWMAALDLWASSPSKGALSVNELISQGRRRSLEAAGYRKLGRDYDAAPLYLWSISLLSEFIEREPSDPRVPEAIYLLGKDYYHLRYAFPSSLRSDQISNLVLELYPDSIWSRIESSNAI